MDVFVAISQQTPTKRRASKTNGEVHINRRFEQSSYLLRQFQPLLLIATKHRTQLEKLGLKLKGHYGYYWHRQFYLLAEVPLGGD